MGLAATPYLDATEAQDYFDSKFNTEAWDEADDTQRGKALANATMIINRLRFSGAVTDTAQPNAFPRNGALNVPDDIKKAACELALFLLDGGDINEEVNDLSARTLDFSSVRMGSERGYVMAHMRAGIPSPEAWQYLLPYLADPLSVTITRID